VVELPIDGEGEGSASSGGGAKSQNNAAENPDVEVIVEALKSLCNILLHNEAGQVRPFVLFSLDQVKAILFV